jgi:hypothetical protein
MLIPVRKYMHELVVRELTAINTPFYHTIVSNMSVLSSLFSTLSSKSESRFVIRIYHVMSYAIFASFQISPFAGASSLYISGFRCGGNFPFIPAFVPASPAVLPFLHPFLPCGAD